LSATFSFAAPSDGPEVGSLAGRVALTEGHATKDGKTVYFVLAAELTDVARTAKDGAVTGCTFDAANIESPGVVTVTGKPRVWFNFVDFGSIDPGTAEAPTVVPAGSVARVGFALGLGQLSAYEFSYQPSTN